MVLSSQSSFPHQRAYVLKLHRDASPRQGQLLGRLEHVASGHQYPFTSGEELLARLIEAVEQHDRPASEDVS
jgi:hypothetical protein